MDVGTPAASQGIIMACARCLKLALQTVPFPMMDYVLVRTLVMTAASDISIFTDTEVRNLYVYKSRLKSTVSKSGSQSNSS